MRASGSSCEPWIVPYGIPSLKIGALFGCSCTSIGAERATRGDGRGRGERGGLAGDAAGRVGDGNGVALDWGVAWALTAGAMAGCGAGGSISSIASAMLMAASAASSIGSLSGEKFPAQVRLACVRMAAYCWGLREPVSSGPGGGLGSRAART